MSHSSACDDDGYVGGFVSELYPAATDEVDAHDFVLLAPSHHRITVGMASVGPPPASFVCLSHPVEGSGASSPSTEHRPGFW